MRPQQQNRRMRGRNNNGGGGNNNNNNNNNRKGPNPLTRNYESNGPDVKIRGSAQQVAEKYAQLARDSHSSGDRVMAENYLQHAEHYNRIIAAAQAQMPIQNPQTNRDNSDDDMDDDRDDFDSQGNDNQANNNQPNVAQGGSQGNGNQGNGNGGGEQPQRLNLGSAPQPVIEGTPAEVALNPEAADGNPRQERQANPANAEGEGPRRGRRPRRGERSRPDLTDRDEASGSDEGLAQTLARGLQPEPAASEPPKSEPADRDEPGLITADN